jgi:hypothetical protein
MCKDRKEWNDYVHSWLQIAIPFLSAVYNSLCVKSFDTFSCIRLRDNSFVMITAPQIVCWESSEHVGMVVLSGISIAVYVCGIPLFVFTVLVYADKYHKLKDPLWLKVFGKFYVSYEPAYYLWELILLFRRFAFCLCMVVFRTNPFAQAGIAIFTIVVCTLFQYVPSGRTPPASTPAPEVLWVL